MCSAIGNQRVTGAKHELSRDWLWCLEAHIAQFELQGVSSTGTDSNYRTIKQKKDKENKMNS